MTIYDELRRQERVGGVDGETMLALLACAMAGGALALALALWAVVP